MQCIDCMFLAIYAVYGLHKNWTWIENLTEISVKTWSIKINIVYSWQNGNNMATTN